MRKLYQGLTALSKFSFPRQCPTCGRHYETPEAFIAETHDMLQSSGLKEEIDDEDQSFVLLFRNCPCGSTLMDEFSNRRNLSPAGIKRRKKFDEIIHRLVRSGISKESARRELINIMQGKGSRLLKVPPSP